MAEGPDPVDRWLQSLAAFDLPGAQPVAPMPGNLNEVLSRASEHRLIGVLAAAVASDAVPLDPDERAQLTLAHEGAMGEVLLLEEVLLGAVDVLTSAGIDHRVLKGSALAHMVHADPSDRCFGDNDVLVRSEDVDAAVEVLLSEGAVRPIPALSPSFDRRFAKSVSLGWRGATELDLHRTLAPGPYGHLVVLEDLFDNPVELILAGRSVLTLPADLHLLHGAIHVALGDVEARLGNVRDLALLARRASVDAQAVLDAADRWRCTAPLAVGLRTAGRLVHVRTELEQWADDYRISELDSRRLDAYRERAGRFRRQSRASLAVLSWRDRLAFMRALARPSAANRGARGRRAPA